MLQLFCITHYLCYVFYPFDNTMAFLSLSVIAPYTHCLIFVWSWQNVCWRTNSILPVACEIDPRAKYCFTLVCRFIFCYFLEIYLYILNFLELNILLICKLSTFSSNTNFRYYRSLTSLFLLIYNSVISGPLQ